MAKFGEWTRCEDELPPINRDAGWDKYVLATDGRNTTILRWTFNRYAATERGKKPRWQDGSRLALFTPTHWMPLPPPPALEPAPDAR